MTQNLNINEMIGRGEIKELKFSPEEHPEERTSRLKCEARSKLLEDVKGMIIFFVLLTGLVAISALCVYLIAYDVSASPETKRWSQTVLAGLVSGSVSYLVGRAVGK